jgi:hypothetical protein
MGAFKSAGKSELFPDFPLNPQNLFIMDEPIRGQSLANVTEIALIICDEFEKWKNSSQGKWPSYATEELSALLRACNRMKMNTPLGILHTVNSDKIRTLVHDYIIRLRNDAKANNDFMNRNWTLWNSMIDFGNTIACGGTLQTTMQYYA